LTKLKSQAILTSGSSVFERFLMLVTGIGNIRDVIPFPRTPGSIEF